MNHWMLFGALCSALADCANTEARTTTNPLRTVVLTVMTGMSMAVAWRFRKPLLRLSLNPESRQFMAVLFYAYWFAFVSQELPPG